MIIARTNRLVLRRFVPSDAAFILELINEPSYHANIGDKGVRTLEEAQAYLNESLIAMYEKNGFGLYMVELADGNVPIGFSGLVNRDGLDGIDLGYAFLPGHWGKGYAKEAALASMHHAQVDLGLNALLAIVSKHNDASSGLLLRLGFVIKGEFKHLESGEMLDLFHCDLKSDV